MEELGISKSLDFGKLRSHASRTRKEKKKKKISKILAREMEFYSAECGWGEPHSRKGEFTRFVCSD
jgi:translation initiation factor IF-3